MNKKRLPKTLISNEIPITKHNRVKHLFINLFPFRFDKWAPLSPPRNEPITNIIKRLIGKVPILLKANAPDAFQKMPTVKKVILIARIKSKP